MCKTNIRRCLEECDGYNYQCEGYSPTEEGRCYWDRIVETDLYKVLVGNRYLTFPQIREWLKGDEI